MAVLPAIAVIMAAVVSAERSAGTVSGSRSARLMRASAFK